MMPENTADVMIIGKPTHTADTENNDLRAAAGTGSCSYSSPRPDSRRASVDAGLVIRLPWRPQIACCYGPVNILLQPGPTMYGCSKALLRPSRRGAHSNSTSHACS